MLPNTQTGEGRGRLSGVSRASGKLVVGLAGGIGSGKSTVASILAERGAAVVSSDELNRGVLATAEVESTLALWYGERIRDSSGHVRRDVLADIVFGDSSQRRRVEKLLHPRIDARRQELITQHRADDRVLAIVLDSPLLFEAGLDQICDAVLFVDASPEIRTERVASERGWSSEELVRREKPQDPLDEKRLKSDYTVVNNSGLDDLRSTVDRLLSELLARASNG